ncbi:14286_t:CDS:2 [Cetraspora pellucida]|uniref:14286_t:CDS:1 n=1 Tax=Cetraspora pellucida TaxID=1433469 RepID=A0A9N8VFX0_9GLOM|nr:14286_t:CDS:2 [Cetraspora pellucida]
MAEDFAHREIPEGQHQIQAVLQSLNIFLQRYMKTVNDYDLPKLSQMNTAELPKTILKELSYHITQEDLDKANILNEAQHAVFNKVLDLINKDEGDANMQVSLANNKEKTFVEYLLRIGNSTESTIDNNLI